MLAGGALILGALLFSARAGLNRYLAAHPAYLPAETQRIEILPIVALSANPKPEPEISPEKAAAAIVSTNHNSAPEVARRSQQILRSDLPTPTVQPSSSPTAQPSPSPTAPLATETPIPPAPTWIAPTEAAPTEQIVVPPTPTLEPVPAIDPVSAIDPNNQVVRIVIPRVKVKRAVVDIGTITNANGNLEWNTDKLFATNNRPDLVGHLEGSSLPGERGNTVLVGHNYDYEGSGVFVNLHKLQVGDEIVLFTESGQEYDYQVVKVKTVSYTGNNEVDVERHARFLAPSEDERLTLVTCGGANIGFFNKRVYVVAEPINP